VVENKPTQVENKKTLTTSESKQIHVENKQTQVGENKQAQTQTQTTTPAIVVTESVKHELKKTTAQTNFESPLKNQGSTTSISDGTKVFIYLFIYSTHLVFSHVSKLA
jgi:hypothetical protein